MLNALSRNYLSEAAFIVNIRINTIFNYNYIINAPSIRILLSVLSNNAFVPCSLINLNF